MYLKKESATTWASGSLLRTIEGIPQVEQVSPFLALTERSQLGSQKLVQRIAQEIAAAGKPARRDRERMTLKAMEREVFPGIDLNLEAHRQIVFRCEPVLQRHAAVTAAAFRLSSPSRNSVSIDPIGPPST